MFFGMCNSLATFQAMMDEIFKKEIEENLIIVYMDDILAFSKTIDGLKKIEQVILEKAREYDLYFKAKKCEFRKPKIEYLGLAVKEGKLAMDPAKYWTGLHCQGFTKLHSGRVQTDSGCRDLKNILIAIPPWTTLDPSWEASAW
jgi:Reverse transcriptase (RNA-dependent DNA polymerase)